MHKPSTCSKPVHQRKPGVSKRWFLIAVFLGALAAAGSSHAANKTRLSIYQHSKPVNYMPCGTQGVISRTAALVGGGVDVPQAFSWMIDKMLSCADGSRGIPSNFVVIRAGGNPSYDSYIYKLGPVGSVITIVVPDRDSALAVGDPTNEVGRQAQEIINNAGAIWLTGGDQSDYYNFWRGTPVESLISNQVQTYSVPIGGTSAGMMILSEFAYVPDAAYSSDFALANPKQMQQWLKNDFWSYRTPFPPLIRTVTDSHFNTRDRMGRLVTFLADVIAMGWASANNARAIGVNQETALLMEYFPRKQTGATTLKVDVQVVANEGADGAAYFLSAGSGSTITVPESGSLTFTNVNVEKVMPADVRETYQLNVIDGQITSTTNSVY